MQDVEAATRHWLEKAVIGLNLCPFARAVYVKNQVRIVVSRARHLDAFLDELDRELLLLRDTPAEQVETTLLVHPEVLHDFAEYNDFLDVAEAALDVATPQLANLQTRQVDAKWGGWQRTELPLILSDDNSPVPCLDTVEIHVESLIRAVISG